MINKYAEIAYRLRLIKAANFMFKQAMTGSQANDFSKAIGMGKLPAQITGMLDEYGISEPTEPAAKGKYSPPTSKPTAADYEKMLANRDEMRNSMIARFNEERALNEGLIKQRDAKITALSEELGISKGQAAELQKQLETQTGLANRYSDQINHYIDLNRKRFTENKALKSRIGALDNSLTHMTHQVAEEQAAKKLLAQKAKYLTRGLVGTGIGAAALSVPAAYGAYHYFNN